MDFFRKVITNRNRNPLPVLRSFYTIPILPLIFFKLNIVQIAKYVRLSHFVEVTEPWQILGLMNGNDQN
jgi:NRPS condensation-like uncharacterized protein